MNGGGNEHTSGLTGKKDGYIYKGVGKVDSKRNWEENNKWLKILWGEIFRRDIRVLFLELNLMF